MAHNQDRLQNSDSSVVYGHGHIIYDSDSGDVGDTPLRQAIKQPTMSLNGPPQKHISVYLSFSSCCEKGMCTFALTFLRTSRIFINLSPNIEFDASPFAFGQENDRLENLFCAPQMTNDFVFQNSNFRLDFCGKFFLLIFKLHFDECRVKSFGKYGLMMQQI